MQSLSPGTKYYGCEIYLHMQCTRAQGLELYANADSCNEILHSNSCPIFTLAAEQVVIHDTTAHNHLFLSARREQIDPVHSPCTLLTASKCKTCTLLTASRYTLLQRSTTTLYFAHREQVGAEVQTAHRERVQSSTLGSSQHTAASCEETHRVFYLSLPLLF